MLYLLYITVQYDCISLGMDVLVLGMWKDVVYMYCISQYGCISRGMGVPVLGMWRDVLFAVYHSMAVCLWAWVCQCWERGEMFYLLYTTVWLYFSGHGCASAGNMDRCCIYCIKQYGCISLGMGVPVLGVWRDVVFTVYHSMAVFLWSWVCQCWECGEMLYLLYKTVWLYFSGHGCASAGSVVR